MNKVVCKVSENGRVQKNGRRGVGSGGFFVKLTVACFAAFVITCAKFAGGVFGDAANKVKEAVCFDFGACVAELLDGGDK